jgi:phage terminase small subunit
MGNHSDLTECQRKFLDLWYTKGQSKKDAYYGAGYTATHYSQAVSRIFKSPSVQREIARRDKLKDIAITNRDKKSLDQLAEDLDRNNSEAFNSGKISESNKAIELLIKLQGGFKEKIEVTQKEDQSDQIDEIIQTTLNKVMSKVTEEEEKG